jgi:hypothetical protein
VPVVPPDPRLTGRWRRTLLVRSDGSTDRTTSVTWLQADTFYVDLRLPVDGAAREGFAGRVRADGPWTCWDRLVDLHPPAATPDEGRLDPDAAGLVETGRHDPYVEHWLRETGPRLPCCAVELIEATTGDPAVLVRVGDDVGWARGRTGPDAEVSLGVVGADGAVTLTSSSRPGRAGTPLDLVADGAGLRESGTGPDGTPVLRRWHVVATEGAAALLPVRSSTPPDRPREAASA